MKPLDQHSNQFCQIFVKKQRILVEFSLLEKQPNHAAVLQKELFPRINNNKHEERSRNQLGKKPSDT